MRSWSALVLMMVILCGPGSADALSPSDAACRKALGSGVQKLAATVLKEQQRCHRVRMSSKDPAGVPPTVDCNDIADLSAKGQGSINKTVVKLDALAGKKCEGVAGLPS